MSIVKLNNRSVKDITSFGSISSLGSLTHIATQTASSSASLSFTSGIDSTYKEYIFYFVDIHPANNNVNFTFNGSDDDSSHSYDVVKTTTAFDAFHKEDGSSSNLSYRTSEDIAQGTGFQTLTLDGGVGNNNDDNFNGYLHLFNPSSTNFVKHFIATTTHGYNASPAFVMNNFISGYFNTIADITAIQFKFSSGNIDSGQILLFGLN
tara:strand:- start:3 stop:623 length:621 start_codon:yes stop_codon:yes gene_type:complete